MDIAERMRRGEHLFQQMLGEDRTAQTRQTWERLSPDFEKYVVEFVAGEIWSRPNLDLKTRSLVTLATLAGLGRTHALELNLRMALRNGASKQEVIESLLQIAPYAGFPAVWDALVMADRVFREDSSVSEDGS